MLGDFLRCDARGVHADQHVFPVKILTVEDDGVARAVLRKALRRLGHETIEALNGETAWDILTKNDDIRVVVSDWTMPTSDGLDLCR